MESTSDPVVGAASVTAEVERHVGYLRIALDAPPDEGWIWCADLLADPDLLLAAIASTQAGRGAPDLQVAASLWFQAYAFRAALPVLAPHALGLPGLSADPAVTHVRIARNRPAAIAVPPLDPITRTTSEAATDLLDGHLAPMVDAVTAVVTVGRRLLWGNAAASCATVFRALEGAPGADRTAVRAQADAFGVDAGPWLQGLGGYDTLTEGEQQGWYWTRTNCCLWDRCDGASRCDDCSLIPTEELEGIRRAALVSAGQVAAS